MLEGMLEFDAELWAWDARRDDTWMFVSVPAEASEEIRDVTGPLRHERQASALASRW